MQAINIVGFKNSGKTGLSRSILTSWEEEKFYADYLKFSHHDFETAESMTDTSRMLSPRRKVFGVSEQQTMVLVNEKTSLVDIFTQTINPFLLIEGGKKLTILPRIVCLKDKNEFAELNNGLAIATYGLDSSTDTGLVPHFTPDNVKELAKLAKEKAFILADLNCEECGRKTCKELGEDIVKGKARPEQCLPLHKKDSGKSLAKVSINGYSLPLNAFVEEIIAESIKGMVKPLKGFDRNSGKNSITIEIKE